MKRLFLATCLLALSCTTVHANAADHGTVLYRTYCTQCHGVHGNGKGLNASQMSVEPRDHSDFESMSTRTDEDLFKVIEHGGKSIDKSVLMPVWGGNFTDDDIHALVGHLRELCCKKK